MTGRGWESPSHAYAHAAYSPPVAPAQRPVPARCGIGYLSARHHRRGDHRPRPIAAPGTACRRCTRIWCFVTRYRRQVFTDDKLPLCEHTMRTVCADLDVGLVRFNGEADYVHLLVHYPPTSAISTQVRRLKGDTVYAERPEQTGSCVRARMRGHPGPRSYFAVSCKGAPLSIIKHYIDGQAPL